MFTGGYDTRYLHGWTLPLTCEAAVTRDQQECRTTVFWIYVEVAKWITGQLMVLLKWIVDEINPIQLQPVEKWI